MNYEPEIENGTEEKPKKLNRLPRFAIAFYISAGVSLLLFLGFLVSEPFADLFNKYVSSVFRAFMARLTGWIPFSLAEFFVIMLPIIVVVASGYAMKRYSDSWRDVWIYCGTALSLLALFFSLFTIGFAPAYRGSRVDKKLGMQRADVSAEELYETALLLSEAVNREVGNVIFAENGASVMPYGYEQMNEELLLAYDKAYDKYDFLQRLDSPLKRVMLSGLMSYTHITGVYTFFTGEANINVDFPDYTLPYTAAHELAHQRGIAREDEANFMAFLVCIDSDDPYLRYSAYLNLYEYVSSALYSSDQDLYFKARETLASDVKGEMAAYSAFYEKYRDSVASEVSETVNNTFLVIQGTEGTKSYGMVVDLAVAYYKTEK